MANIVSVTKQSVIRTGETTYAISVKMVVNGEGQDIFICSASAEYNSATPDIPQVKADLISGLKEQWDRFTAERQLLNSDTFDKIVRDIRHQAKGYVA